MQKRQRQFTVWPVRKQNRICQTSRYGYRKAARRFLFSGQSSLQIFLLLPMSPHITDER